MKTPRLNRQLVLETRQQVADGSGGFSETWVGLGVLWADVCAKAGSERSEGGLPLSQVTYRILVRAALPGSSARPKPDQRFCEGARHFKIVAVAEADSDGRYLACTCVEEIA
ncbi:MAG: head-tail adaptor protein [Pseudooceanicola sp.]|nr:head-tail adaptor protein [Pseudooceanicola sp.]